MKKVGWLMGFMASMLLLAACGNSEEKAAAQPKENQGAEVQEQIPAAEILGSTITRHLRLQPEKELSAILDDPDQIVNHISAVSGSFRKEIGKIPQESPQRGTVYVAEKADGTFRLWYSFPTGEPSQSLKMALKKGMNHVKRMELKQGLIVFGVAISLWGFKETDEEAAEVVLPAVWTQAAENLGGSQPAATLALETWDQGD